MSSQPSSKHDEDKQRAQWQAARSSRRDGEMQIIVIRRDRKIWETMVVIASLIVGIVLGMGGGLHLRAATILPAPPPPQRIVVAATATKTPTPSPSPSPTPPPTATMTPSLTPTATSSPTLTSTPAATNTATPTVTPLPPVAIITATALNVRAGPGVAYDIVGYAALGQRYRIVGGSEDNGWVRIDFGGLDGWVSGRWVKIVSR